MSLLSPAPADRILSKPELFPFDKWDSVLNRLASEYKSAEPFPHIHLTDFLETAVAGRIRREFPDPADAQWIHYRHYNENKLAMSRRDLFPAATRRLIDALESPRFIQWLSVLTGIPNLIADCDLEGGGMHQSTRNGFLNIHSDFTTHHHHPDWRRRVNLILYLNEDWDPGWGGAIQLWDATMRECVVRIAPLFNHALIFNTDETSYHGCPEKLTCPDGVTRKSLALYYYTVQNDLSYAAQSTNYRARPCDSMLRSGLIRLDKIAVGWYSKLKSKLGLSDRLAGRLLGLSNRRR